MRLNFKTQLEEAGISRYKLAQLLGVTYPTITKMYNGEVLSINLNTLEQLCLILKCSPNDILIFEDSNNIYEKYPSLKHNSAKVDVPKKSSSKKSKFVVVDKSQSQGLIAEEMDKVFSSSHVEAEIATCPMQSKTIKRESLKTPSSKANTKAKTVTKKHQ